MTGLLRQHRRHGFHLVGGMWAVCAALGSVQGEITFEPSWDMPRYADVRQQVHRWIDGSRYEAEKAAVARSFWPSVDLRDADGANLLQRAAETFAAVDERARALVDACSRQYVGPMPPDASWLEDQDVAEFVRHNLSLYYARWLAQRGLYDEVLETLERLTPEAVIDPAGLLFYRMVAHHQLVEPEESLSALVQLLEHESTLPRRYQQVAELLRRDLEGLQDESLDHIARRMNDVRRRLQFGRAGKKVQLVEQGVLDSLDKLIEKLEQQAQQQGSCSAGGLQPSGTPMQDSRLPSMRAPMQVDQRDVGSESGWGDLPPQEREQALQQIGRDFPAHYRELIEQYFRDLADQSATAPSE